MCVHTTHCCSRHGCKYGDNDCPVEKGLSKQEYPCEECDFEQEDYNINKEQFKHVYIVYCCVECEGDTVEDIFFKEEDAKSKLLELKTNDLPNYYHYYIDKFEVK